MRKENKNKNKNDTQGEKNRKWLKNPGNQVREREMKQIKPKKEEGKEKQRQSTASKQANHESVRTGGDMTKRCASALARARVTTGGCIANC